MGDQQQRGAAAVGSIRVLTLPPIPKMEGWLKSNRPNDESLIKFGHWYDQQLELWRRQVEGLLGTNFNTIRLLEGGVDGDSLTETEVQALIDASLAGISTGGVTREEVIQIVTAANATFIWQQYPAAATWVIPHNLNRFPPVSVIDSAGSVVGGDVTYLSSNVVQIDFASAFAGTAYLA